MTDVIIQKGHCFRKKGATGTQSAHRGTEQAFVSRVADLMVPHLRSLGITAKTVLADPGWLGSCKVFVALHQDGSTNKSARGASVGYPSSKATNSNRFTDIWKARYQAAGFPSGFRPDNYTGGLRGYYGYRLVDADVEVVLEHGFATNTADADWMWDNIEMIAQVNAEAIAQYLGNKNIQATATAVPDPTPNTVPPRKSISSRVTKSGRRYLRREHPMIVHDDVAVLQRAVGVTADRIFGDDTDAALREFQKERKIQVDGVAGEETWGEIDRPKKWRPLLWYRRGNIFTGAHVEDLQRWASKYRPTRIDGDFGPDTEKSVRVGQSRNRAKVDGIAGNETWSIVDG